MNEISRMKKIYIIFIAILFFVGGLIFASVIIKKRMIDNLVIDKIVEQPIDIVEGSPNAPKTMEVIESLTCIHCQNWTKHYYPDFKKNFIDTGKVKLIIRDFPIDKKAAQAAILVQCLPKEKRLDAHKKLLLTFQDWAMDKTDEQTYLAEKRILGVSDDELKCSQDNSRWETLTKSRKDALDKYHLIATPTFLIPPKALAGDDENNIDTINEWAKK